MEATNQAAGDTARGGITNLRPWRRGESGNVRGRPKRDAEIAELARAHTADAIGTLVAIMKDPNAPHSSRVAAANTILDRGWGKPRMSLDMRHEVSLAGEFEAFLKQLHASRDAK